jgi:putative oxidoreductase
VANRILKMIGTDSAFSKDLGILFLRVSYSVTLLSVHVFQKILMLSANASTYPDPFGMGHRLSLLSGLSLELVCSVLILFGIYTRLAAVPLVFNWALISLVVYGGGPFSKQELPLFFLLVTIAFVFTGAGRFSWDRRWLR